MPSGVLQSGPHLPSAILGSHPVSVIVSDTTSCPRPDLCLVLTLASACATLSALDVPINRRMEANGIGDEG